MDQQHNGEINGERFPLAFGGKAKPEQAKGDQQVDHAERKTRRVGGQGYKINTPDKGDIFPVLDAQTLRRHHYGQAALGRPAQKIC